MDWDIQVAFQTPSTCCVALRCQCHPRGPIFFPVCVSLSGLLPSSGPWHRYAEMTTITVLSLVSRKGAPGWSAARGGIFHSSFQG